MRKHMFMRDLVLPAAVALNFAACAATQDTLVEVPSPVVTPQKAAAPETRPAGQIGLVPKDTADKENIALSREKGQERLFVWQEWSKEVFDKARLQGRYILLDGAAEWCHWCHVMDETTYVDPEVGKTLRDRFVAIRIDVDQRPDVADRYQEWGWPATVIFSPDAQEIGKFRGYVPPERMREILRDSLAEKAGAAGVQQVDRLGRLPAPAQALPWIGARVLLDLDDRYDEDEGGWGTRQKYPAGANIEFELVRKKHGDEAAGKRAIFTLQKQRPLIDPVWGGMYQYSIPDTWDHPHFEKLMPVQAANIEAYARGYAATQDAALLADARHIAGYLQNFLSNRDGAFLVSQDADVNAHDRKSAFVDGHVYYARDDAGRRALGIPRIDDHVYARENGLGIAAFATLYEVSHDAAVLAHARRAADLMLRTHVEADGSVRREEKSAAKVYFLADAAALGRGLARLAEVSGEAPYKNAAIKIAGAMLKNFGNAKGPPQALYANTPDPAAAGVFAQRAQPFDPNVIAVRFLATLSRITADASWRKRASQVLAATATPRGIADQGRLVGDFLLALEDAGVFSW